MKSIGNFCISHEDPKWLSMWTTSRWWNVPRETGNVRERPSSCSSELIELKSHSTCFDFVPPIHPEMASSTNSSSSSSQNGSQKGGKLKQQTNAPLARALAIASNQSNNSSQSSTSSCDAACLTVVTSTCSPMASNAQPRLRSHTTSDLFGNNNDAPGLSATCSSRGPATSDFTEFSYLTHMQRIRAKATYTRQMSSNSSDPLRRRRESIAAVNFGMTSSGYGLNVFGKDSGKFGSCTNLNGTLCFVSRGGSWLGIWNSNQSSLGLFLWWFTSSPLFVVNWSRVTFIFVFMSSFPSSFIFFCKSDSLQFPV